MRKHNYNLKKSAAIGIGSLAMFGAASCTKVDTPAPSIIETSKAIAQENTTLGITDKNLAQHAVGTLDFLNITVDTNGEVINDEFLIDWRDLNGGTRSGFNDKNTQYNNYRKIEINVQDPVNNDKVKIAIHNILKSVNSVKPGDNRLSELSVNAPAAGVTITFTGYAQMVVALQLAQKYPMFSADWYNAYTRAFATNAAAKHMTANGRNAKNR